MIKKLCYAKIILEWKKDNRGNKMKDSLITYAYRGFLSVIYFLTGKKEKINDIFSVNKKNTNNIIVNNKVKNENIKKQHYRYKVKNRQGKIIKGTFDAYNMEQVKRFLMSQDYEVIDVSLRSKYDIDIYLTNPISITTLSFTLTQISTYLRAGMTLIDSVKVIAKQEKNKERKKIYQMIVCDLLSGDDFSTALSKQDNIFPKLLINMTKSAELTGDLPNVLDEMAEYYSSISKTKKEIKSAMTYPTIVFIFSIFVVTFILVWVVPQYQSMFASYNASLPKITVAIINFSSFLRNNLLTILLIFIAILLIYIYLFRKVSGFRYTMQKIYMHVPVFKNIIIYSEVSMFARTFASLLNHGVYITDSMEVLLNVSDNEVYKRIIIDTVNNLNSGGKISDAFKDHWAFPSAAYEMIVTGENTGRLGTMMEKVADYYDNLHTNAVSSIKSLIEPILIVFLAISVGIIVLSILLPMFEMYRIVS